MFQLNLSDGSGEEVENSYNTQKFIKNQEKIAGPPGEQIKNMESIGVFQRDIKAIDLMLATQRMRQIF